MQTKQSELQKEMLTCQICGKKFLSLVPHVTREHKLTTTEYKTKFEVKTLVVNMRGKVKTEPLKSKASNEWTKVRNAVKKRAGDKCEVCGISNAELLLEGKHGLSVHETEYKIITDPASCTLCCSSCHRKIHLELQKNSTPLDQAMRHISRASISLFKALGIDLHDRNFLETPRRFSAVLSEFSGVGIDFGYELEEICNSIFENDSEGIVVARNIESYSLCPHHLLPVHYSVDIAYLPHGYNIGLSKLGRLAVVLGKKLQLQETYTKEIANALVNHLKTPDVAVITTGEHFCIRMRGVEDPNCTVVVSEMRGAFREQSSTRLEFLSLLK